MAGVIFSKNQPAGLYGFLKFFEFFFFGFYISRKLKTKKDFGILSLFLSFGVVLESIIAVLQFINQESVGGILYFVGERNFNGQTPGIANASINGKLILRPYGTLPHPNVLAGYLTIAMAIVISNIKYQISNIIKILLLFSVFVGIIALFLTMSRVAIIAWFIVVLFAGFSFFKKKTSYRFFIYYAMLIILLIAVLLSSPIGNRFASLSLGDESVIIREQLVNASFLMVQENPVLGVGVNNFLVNLPSSYKTTNGIFNIQPVHNIFLLIFSELGILGLLFFLWFLFITFKRIQKKKFSIFPLGFAQGGHFQFSIFFVVLFIGLFDHYFLTLQQGQILLSLVFGIVWSDLNNI
ncbi:MAG: O-antigen ligase family protein [Patescibacteria group bacterium]|nr:O-antigen ligase family protein [Patescibacteria group bacterium]